MIGEGGERGWELQQLPKEMADACGSVRQGRNSSALGKL